jgi:hypothetical protein
MKMAMKLLEIRKAVKFVSFVRKALPFAFLTFCFLPNLPAFFPPFA